MSVNEHKLILVRHITSIFSQALGYKVQLIVSIVLTCQSSPSKHEGRGAAVLYYVLLMSRYQEAWT